MILYLQVGSTLSRFSHVTCVYVGLLPSGRWHTLTLAGVSPHSFYFGGCPHLLTSKFVIPHVAVPIDQGLHPTSTHPTPFSLSCTHKGLAGRRVRSPLGEALPEVPATLWQYQCRGLTRQLMTMLGPPEMHVVAYTVDIVIPFPPTRTITSNDQGRVIEERPVGKSLSVE